MDRKACTKWIAAACLVIMPLGMVSADTEDAPANKEAADCYHCGTIEAISQRIVPAGVNGYYTYNVHIRMDETRLLRVVPAAMRGTLDVGDRVQIVGGVIQPVPPNSKPAPADPKS